MKKYLAKKSILFHLICLRKGNDFAPLWVVDFPLLEFDEESGITAHDNSGEGQGTILNPLNISRGVTDINLYFT
jgi:hypothetical protein